MFIWINIRTLLAPGALCGVIFLLSFNLVLQWLSKDLNVVSGDEPHYLMIAKALSKGLLFEQSEIYRSMPRVSGIFPNGLSQDDWHLVTGPNGRFSVHNLGLPFIVSPAFERFGVIGAKAMTVAMASVIPILMWYVSSSFSAGALQRFITVLGISICPAVLAGGTQIYPDLPAGMLALVGVYLLSRSTEQLSYRSVIFCALALAYLPWLQVKFGPMSFCLMFALALKTWLESKSSGFPLSIATVGLISMVLLLGYNQMAFGKFSGPYNSNDVEVSKTSLMVFWGLLMDQNQGFLFQNPIQFIGVIYLGSFLKARPFLAMTIVLVCLTLLVPSALHPNWYGGGSFSGRFGWPTGIIFSVVTLYGMLRLSTSKPAVFFVTVLICLLVQSEFYLNYLSGKISLYTKAIETPASQYGIFYPWITNELPMLFNVHWAYRYLPNYIWVMALVVLFVIGARMSGSIRR